MILSAEIIRVTVDGRVLAAGWSAEDDLTATGTPRMLFIADTIDVLSQALGRAIDLEQQDGAA